MAERSRLVLVTGGAGFVGSHLVDALAARRFPVEVLDNLSTGRRENLSSKAVLIQADLHDFASINRAFVRVDTVFHEAALARVPPSIEKPVETHMANVVGTLHVLKAARDAGVVNNSRTPRD